MRRSAFALPPFCLLFLGVPSVQQARTSASVLDLREDGSGEYSCRDSSLEANAFTIGFKIADSTCIRAAAFPRVAYSEGSLSYSARAWSGNDPFNQPFNTTDYYGSGDVDLDGVVTSEDVELSHRMATGVVPPVSRADVNGDGWVNSFDVAMIESAVNGGALPGWWNTLRSREERNRRIGQFLSRDRTNNQKWRNWFQCYDFAEQTYLHATGYPSDDHYPDALDGGQTCFNMPLYVVGVASKSFGHLINAVLVGENPLEFTDWRFIEPQTDKDVHPGGGNMPYGTSVQILSILGIQAGLMTCTIHVTFYIDKSGWKLLSYNPLLVLTRSTAPASPTQNQAFLWNPRPLDSRSGVVLFERYRDDLSRTTDIHIADVASLHSPDAAGSIPVTKDSTYSRLLDLVKGADGVYHILWAGERGYRPAIYHAILDPAAGTISHVTTVYEHDLTSYTVAVLDAKLIVTPNGGLHVLWRSLKAEGEEGSICWTEWNGSGWNPPKRIVPDTCDVLSRWWPVLGGPDEFLRLRYAFDVCPTVNNDIDLVWNEPRELAMRVHHMRFDGNRWSAPSAVDSSFGVPLIGVALRSTPDNRTHFVYLKNDPISGVQSLVYRSFNGYRWSAPTLLDNEGEPFCPNLVNAEGSGLYLVWQASRGGQVVPCWRKLSVGGWGSPHVVGVSTGFNCLYPRVCVLSHGGVLAVWSARSEKAVTIGYAIVDSTRAPDSPVDSQTRISLSEVYPNPFNLATIITYSLEDKMPVTIEIFGILGNRVRTLVNEVKAAGLHDVTFDAAGLPSGVYFCLMRAGNYTASRRLLWIK